MEAASTDAVAVRGFSQEYTVRATTSGLQWAQARSLLTQAIGSFAFR